MVNEQVDILIIGGGLTGASLLLALQNSPWQCRMVDNRAFDTVKEPELDARSLALAPASIRILQQLGVGDTILKEACPIKTIHVSQQGQFGNSHLHAQSDALGYVIEMNHLNRIVLNALEMENIYAPARFQSLNTVEQYADVEYEGGLRRIHYKLLVAADGAQSAVRQTLGIHANKRDYRQHAIICNVALKRAHEYWAYERFTRFGPLAMLPLTGKRAAMVWAMKPEQAEELMQLTPAEFLKRLQQAFGYRLGRLEGIGQRARIPLQMVLADKCVVGNVVCIGSAAQHLHPVAGQGFNLALRDVATLAQCLYASNLEAKALQSYAEMRKTDRQAICRFTDALVRLFSSSLPGVSALRGMGLLAFDNLPPLQDTLAHYARGFSGNTPNLACGIPLSGEAYGV